MKVAYLSIATGTAIAILLVSVNYNSTINNIVTFDYYGTTYHAIKVPPSANQTVTLDGYQFRLISHSARFPCDAFAIEVTTTNMEKENFEACIGGDPDLNLQTWAVSTGKYNFGYAINQKEKQDYFVVKVSSILDNQERIKVHDEVQEQQDVAVPRLHAPLTIEVQPEGFTGMANEITYELILQRGESATIVAELETHTKDDLPVEVYVTYDASHTPFMMPPGVKATADKSHVILKPGQKVQVSIKFQADNDAADAWYIAVVYAKWSEVNGFVGTPFYLKIGKGSNCVTIWSEDGSYCFEP